MMKLTKYERTALTLAALPFIIRVGERATMTINGVTTVRWDYNYAGVLLGLVALLVIYMAVRDLFASQAYKPEPLAPHYAICAPIALLAIYQIAKGASLLI
jgi:hypothetical protein